MPGLPQSFEPLWDRNFAALTRGLFSVFDFLMPTSIGQTRYDGRDGLKVVKCIILIYWLRHQTLNLLVPRVHGARCSLCSPFVRKAL